MPSSSAIRAGKASVELLVHDRVSEGLRRAAVSLKSFARVADRVGMQMMRTGVMMAVPVAMAGRAFATFEKQMAEVSTMIDVPSKHLRTLSDDVLKMSKHFGVATEGLSRGLYNILSATVPVEKSIEVLGVSAKAAVAGLSDVGQTADVITGVLNAYGMETSDATKVSDILFTTVKRGKTTFSELSNNLGKMTAIAATAGIEFEEVGAAIATVTRNAIPTDIAVTGLRQAFSTLLKPASQSAEMFEKMFGMTMDSDALSKMGGLPGLIKNLSTLTDFEIATIFPDRRALTAILPLVRNLQALEKDMSLMRNSTGATEKAFEKMTSTMSYVFDQIVQHGKAVFTVMGEQLSVGFQKLAVNIKQALVWTEQFIKQNQAMVLAFVKWTAIIFTAGVGLKILSLALGSFIPLLKVAGVVVLFLGKAVLKLVTKFGFLLPLLGAITLAIHATSQAFDWGLTLMQSLAVAIGIVIGAWVAYKAILLAVIAVKVVFTAAMLALKAIMLIATNPILLFGTALLTTFGLCMAQAIKTQGVFDGFGKNTSKIFGNIKDDAVTAFGGIVTAMKMGKFEMAAEMAVLGLKAIWGGFWAWLKDIWRRGSDGIIDYGKDVVDTIIFAWNEFWFQGGEIWAGLLEGIITAFWHFTNWIDDMWTETWNWVKGVWHDISGLGDSSEELAEKHEEQKRIAWEARQRDMSVIEKKRLARYEEHMKTQGALFEGGRRQQNSAAERAELLKEDLKEVNEIRENLEELSLEIQIADKFNEFERKRGMLEGATEHDAPVEAVSDEYIDALVNSVSGEIEAGDLPDIEIPQLASLSDSMGDMSTGMDTAANAILMGHQGAFQSAAKLRNITDMLGREATWENSVLDKLDSINGHLRHVDKNTRAQLKGLLW